MEASRILVRCLLIVVIFTLKVDGSKTDPWNKAENCMRYSDIKETFLEGRSASIMDEACMFQGMEMPTLEDLSDMFNILNGGSIPKYIIDNNYSFLANFTGTYSYSIGHAGFIQQWVFGAFHKEGEVMGHTTFDFRFFNGAGYTFSYTSGQALFTHVLYTMGEDSLVYKASTLGAFVFKMPDGKYYMYGNYTGLSEGSVLLIDDTVSHQVETVGILEEADYYSRDITHISARSNAIDITQQTNIYSTTGGSNSTIIYFGKVPSEGNVWTLDMKGNVFNSDKEATLTGQGMTLMDTSKPFSEQNLPWIFDTVRSAVAIYLP